MVGVGCFRHVQSDVFRHAQSDVYTPRCAVITHQCAEGAAFLESDSYFRGCRCFFCLDLFSLNLSPRHGTQCSGTAGNRVQSNEGARGRDDRRSPSGETLATADVSWFQSAWRLPGHEERSRLPRCLVLSSPLPVHVYLYHILLCFFSY